MADIRKVDQSSFSSCWIWTCFLPATKALKELLPTDKPLTQYAVEEAVDAGLETLFLDWVKRAIEDHLIPIVN